MEATLSHGRSVLVGRQDLKDLPTPESTATHFPIPHWKFVETLAESLFFRHLDAQPETEHLVHGQSRVAADRSAATDLERAGVRFADTGEHGAEVDLGSLDAPRQRQCCQHGPHVSHTHGGTTTIVD